MKALASGLAVAAVQVLLIGSVGGKFLVDRARYPRVWAATAPFDPNMPIRGRYARLSAVVQVDFGTASRLNGAMDRVHLAVRDNELVAVPDALGHMWIRQGSCGERRCWMLTEPLAYFIPEHASDPSRLPAGEELWVEVSIPPTGPPRPVRLGVKSAGAFSVIQSD
jgi:hypothetical protein